jgi:branched-chain amino acid transport system ATP-binding protein
MTIAPAKLSCAREAPALMRVRDLHAFYGKSHIIQGLDLDVGPGEIVSVLGRNGVGRSTMLKAIMGDVDVQGSVEFAGREMVGLQPYEIARRGLGYVPENREVFAGLTVRENLMMGERSGNAGARWTMEQMFDLFPRLRARAEAPAGVLSGGEQQMLTIGRALMTNPDLLILDEATEGLAPLIAREIWRILSDIRAHGIAALIVDKNYRAVTAITDRNVILVKGRVVFEGDSRTLLAHPDILHKHLGV